MSAFLLFVALSGSLILWISEANDMTVTISEDAIHDLVTAYLPLLQKASHRFAPYSDGVTRDNVYCSWKSIKVANLSYSDVYIDFHPHSQSFTFSITDLTLHSNVFDFAIKYGLLHCDGNAQILINNWNISINLSVSNSEYRSNLTNGNQLDIGDCELQLNVDEDSLQIEKPEENTVPMYYTFDDYLCDRALNNAETTKMFGDLTDRFIHHQLPRNFQRMLRESINHLQLQSQELHLKVGHARDTLVICYNDLVVTSNTSLVIAATILNNLTTDDDISGGDESEDALFSKADQGWIPYFVEISVLSTVTLFTLIGLVCSIRNRCYCGEMRRLCKNEKIHDSAANAKVVEHQNLIHDILQQGTGSNSSISMSSM